MDLQKDHFTLSLDERAAVQGEEAHGSVRRRVCSQGCLACPVLRVSREGAKLGCFDFIYLISEVMKNKENNGIKLKIKNT